MKPYQFDILFGIAALGAVLLMFGPAIHLDIHPTPLTLSGYMAILGYVLNHRGSFLDRFRKKNDKDEDK